MTLRHVDLCSGIGGFSLGFEWAGLSQPIFFCDIEKWCRDILHQHWPDVPIAEDVKELANDPTQIPDCDILTAGYPCQPFSAAGKRKGEEDDRHIWPYIRKIVAHKRPTWVVFENVYGHVSMGLDQVLSDLEADGYTTRPFVVPAAGVDAPHRRDRVWIVGYTEHDGPSATEVGRSSGEASNDNQEGQTTTSQSEGTSRPRDSGEVAEGARAEPVGNPQNDRCEGGSETTGREGQTHQQVERPSVWSEPSRPSEDVANTTSSGSQAWRTDRVGDDNVSQWNSQQPESTGSQRGSQNVANTNEPRPQGRLRGGSDEEWQGEHGYAGRSSATHRQPSEDQSHVKSRLGGMGDGLPNWLDEPQDIPRIKEKPDDKINRLQGLGNAIVPQVAMQIGLTIKRTIEKG